LISVFNSKIINFNVDFGFKGHRYTLEGSTSRVTCTTKSN